VASGAVAASLAAFIIVYSVVFSIGIHYIRRLIKKGPSGASVGSPPLPQGLPNRPLAHAQEPAREARGEEPSP
jgi:cytochrome d ubiquinol oxidase subunit I